VLSFVQVSFTRFSKYCYFSCSLKLLNIFVLQQECAKGIKTLALLARSKQINKINKLLFKHGRTVNVRASCAGGREFVSQRPDKSYTALQTVRHRFNIYAGSCATFALWRVDGHSQLVTRFGIIQRV